MGVRGRHIPGTCKECVQMNRSMTDRWMRIHTYTCGLSPSLSLALSLSPSLPLCVDLYSYLMNIYIYMYVYMDMYNFEFTSLLVSVHLCRCLDVWVYMCISICISVQKGKDSRRTCLRCLGTGRFLQAVNHRAEQLHSDRKGSGAAPLLPTTTAPLLHDDGRANCCESRGQ